VLLYIPYTLLAKQLNSSTDVYAGFVAIRVGIFVGALLLMIGSWKELKQFCKKSILVVASIKEVFGMAANFLVMFAMAVGPAGMVQSILNSQSAGILVAGAILAKFGLIRESLKRRDMVQKTLGVALAIVATTLLFI
jgi:hypothetical protein